MRSDMQVASGDRCDGRVGWGTRKDAALQSLGPKCLLLILCKMAQGAASLLRSSRFQSHQAFEYGASRDEVGGGILRTVYPRVSLCQQVSGAYPKVQSLPDHLVRVQIQTSLCDHPVLDAAHGPSSWLHSLLVIHD